MSRSRVQIEISLGILLTLIAAVVLILYALNENQRMALFDRQEKAKAIEVGASLYEANCSGCHGPQGRGVEGVWPPLNDPNFFNNRMKETGWSGTLEDYIIATVSSGRLVSTRPDKYPGTTKPAMPSWSEKFGGPLRDDQIRDIAAFVLNWQATAGEVPTTTVEVKIPVGTDITKVLPKGDPAKGSALALSLGCAVCHITSPVGPAWQATADQPGIGNRATTRFTQTGYTGTAKTPEQYLFESIVLPEAYVVSGFQPGIMPKTYSGSLNDQDIADLIAYLLTLK
jgi:mono/diheme cytochrome c family protein